MFCLNHTVVRNSKHRLKKQNPNQSKNTQKTPPKATCICCLIYPRENQIKNYQLCKMRPFLHKYKSKEKKGRSHTFLIQYSKKHRIQLSISLHNMVVFIYQDDASSSQPYGQHLLALSSKTFKFKIVQRTPLKKTQSLEHLT